MERRLKVLISAYACEPIGSSELAVGWNMATQLQRTCDVHVLTRANNRQVIENHEQAHGKTGVHWVYYDTGKWLLSLKKAPGGVWMYYTLWQMGILPLCTKLHAEHRFDLVHHLTFGSFLMPTFLDRLNAPMIWGPVGGALLFNRQLARNFSTKGKLLECLRAALIKSGAVRLLQRHTLRHSARVLAVSEESRSALRVDPGKFEVFSQVGISEQELEHLLQIPIERPKVKAILMVGRLLHWKGMAIGIKAFQQLRKQHPDATLTILGSGGDEAFLKKLAKKEDLARGIDFIGQVSRQQYFDYVESSDILLFPSSHEPGAYVVVESMAAGRPVICMDYGEPATLVSGGGGIVVDPGQAAGIIGGFTDAMSRLFQDPAKAQQMGEAGRRKVRNTFSWKTKGDQMAQIYERCARNGRKTQPQPSP